MRFGERSNLRHSFQKCVAINLVEYCRTHSCIVDVRIKQNQPRSTQFERRLIKVTQGTHACQLGRHVSVLNDPADDGAEETVRRILAALEMSGSWEGDVRNMRKDGTPFWSHAAISMFDHPDHGKVWISVHEDLMERAGWPDVQELYDFMTGMGYGREFLGRDHEAHNFFAPLEWSPPS